MIIDCDTCTERGAACADCVVTFLTIPVRPRSPTQPAGHTEHSQHTELGADEQRAIEVLAASGLVPPLRMVRAM
ncbi:hypothetical protein [Cellulomonas sp. URHD0024]|uniref:hypothetical protein n=1 Tax=Cellulomonas sp. URHD0024 TaxID=1302620 RepID=UPI0003FCE18F|nr:hypothetical protein [Cellulomonas sp. URHD0024]